MVNVQVGNGRAVFDVIGWHRIWSFRSRFDVPLAHIRGARHDPSVTLGWWKGWRIPGVHIPGYIVAGTFHRHGERAFWDVMRGENAIVVDLVNESHDRLIIEVADPRATVQRLQDAIADGGR